MMKKSQQKAIFYEAMWFSEDDSEEPVVRGSNVDVIIEKLLDITKDSGWIEVYQISYNDRGYKIQLQKKFYVLNEFEI